MLVLYTDGVTEALNAGGEQFGLIRLREAVTSRLFPSAPDVSTGVLLVTVPYTTPELTGAALKHAGFCSDLNIYISLIDIQVVPFSCPLDQPPINRAHSHRRFHKLLIESGLRGRASVIYARDWLEGFRRMLDPNSLLVVASKKRCWRTREEKLARALSNAGHEVILFHV